MQGDVDAPQWQRPLVFPLPAKLVSSGRDRGLNIAWTSLQLDWQQDAEDEAIDQMTHPDDALAFIRARPELMEVCQAHPERLANYLPQLLIPEFSAEFGAAFDHLLERSMAEKVTNPDGRRPNAKCARYLALRHPTLGDHTAIDVAKRWVRGQGGFISAAASPEIQYIFWLLGDESHWLPPAIRNVLISGLRSNGYWVAESLINLGPSSALFKACFDAKSVKWTKSQRQELLNLIDEANRDLGLLTPPLEIAERFIAADIVGGFHEILVERKQRGRK
jgi:hypothetical protein